MVSDLKPLTTCRGGFRNYNPQKETALTRGITYYDSVTNCTPEKPLAIYTQIGSKLSLES
jgi:hypothetical protein